MIVTHNRFSYKPYVLHHCRHVKYTIMSLKMYFMIVYTLKAGESMEGDLADLIDKEHPLRNRKRSPAYHRDR